MEHLGERLYLIHGILFPVGRGGSVPWFRRELEAHGVEVPLRTVYGWAQRGSVPESRLSDVGPVLDKLTARARAHLLAQLQALSPSRYH